jgi:phage terminase large subunit-like protein
MIFYETWRREGWLSVTPGRRINYDYIRSEVKALSELYRIREIGFDPWNAGGIATALGETDGFVMTEVRQGFKDMSAPCKELEALVVDHEFKHMGNPVLRWCQRNAVVETNAEGQIRPDKENAKGKIDGIVACGIGLSCGIIAIDNDPYRDRGLRTL